MGSREDRLDALLAAVVPSPPRTDDPEYAVASAPGEQAASVEPQLAPLLEAASELALFATERPSIAFTARLGQRMLARAEQLREEGLSSSTLNGAAESALGRRAAAPSAMRYPVRTHPWRHTPVRGMLRRAVIAAAALVALGIGGWTIASVYGAAPGSALFSLHQMGENISLSFMDQRGRAQAHIQAAHQWLDELRAETGTQGNDVAYGATLNALLGENAAAAQAIQQMTPGAARDTLNAEFTALRVDERAALRAALLHISWPDRLITTQALSSLAESVPQVTNATVTQRHGLWQVTLRGSGFEPGAILFINGKPAGSVISVTGTTLIAQAPSGLFRNGSAALGLGNPDGTAANTTAVAWVAAPTATPNGHGGNGGSNPHSSPTHTPGANGTGNPGSSAPNVAGSR